MAKDFQADQPFEVGVRRINEAIRVSQLDTKRIVTSQDPGVSKAEDLLRITTVPDGFTKFQLPVYLDGASQFYVTTGEEGAFAPEHSHEGDTLRFLVSGEIEFGDAILRSGDWVFIPAGQKYSYRVKHKAVVICSYKCCC